MNGQTQLQKLHNTIDFAARDGAISPIQQIPNSTTVHNAFKANTLFMSKVNNEVSITNQSPAFGVSSNKSEKDLKLVDKDPNLDKDISIKKPIS